MSLLKDQLSKANDVIIMYIHVYIAKSNTKLSKAEVTYKYLTT